MVVIMDKRSEVFQYFGPKLSEALLRLTYREINKLRKEQGMPEITMDDVYDEVLNDALHLPDYKWMDETND